MEIKRDFHIKINTAQWKESKLLKVAFTLKYARKCFLPYSITVVEPRNGTKY